MTPPNPNPPTPCRHVRMRQLCWNSLFSWNGLGCCIFQNGNFRRCNPGKDRNKPKRNFEWKSSQDLMADQILIVKIKSFCLLSYSYSLLKGNRRNLIVPVFCINTRFRLTCKNLYRHSIQRQRGFALQLRDGRKKDDLMGSPIPF